MKRHNEEGTIKDLALYRIETAKGDLHSAKILYEADAYRGANNRAYYGIYHAVSAVHALDGNAYKRHKDALANFNKNYIKTEVFPRSLGRKISEAEEIGHAKRIKRTPRFSQTLVLRKARSFFVIFKDFSKDRSFYKCKDRKSADTTEKQNKKSCIHRIKTKYYDWNV